eukprot:CAMPEP_0206438904 /NCGR_PEP_ID=MMETSP0324_2-20121206/11907_1 /ASSEMBLY_ACC=CAM_ASM_000836 /TAXON_ID=2866 /ORGANISM="Crypthecodinium cohnii, Strain Seligo" /LENGTH=633 /DNA_ID=CAMNT_0053906451 /DNA_START=72 /DNA_END=1970 /DNA_ORIENTATION=-
MGETTPMLEASADQYLRSYFNQAAEDDREKLQKRLKLILSGVARQLPTRMGVVKVDVFGSFKNGMTSGASDIDMVALTEREKDNLLKATDILQAFQNVMKDRNLIGESGIFANVTTIYQAQVPLLKFTDRESNCEVDFCVNNRLGVENSKLLLTYGRYDERVSKLGRLVKDWAKAQGLVGTADGHLNSYAYMLMTIFFLQQLEDPVVPNLQSREGRPDQQTSEDEWSLIDTKYGMPKKFDAYFCNDFSKLPEDQQASRNTMTLVELLRGFFRFYSDGDFLSTYAVSMRRGKAEPKSDFACWDRSSSWVIEDPFDDGHNLARGCTESGIKRILSQMKSALETLADDQAQFKDIFKPSIPEEFLLKCRRGVNMVSPDPFFDVFEDVQTVHFPREVAKEAQVFLQFNNATARRKAHAKNEKFIIPDVTPQLFVTSAHSRREARQMFDYQEYPRPQVTGALTQNAPWCDPMSFGPTGELHPPVHSEEARWPSLGPPPGLHPQSAKSSSKFGVGGKGHMDFVPKTEPFDVQGRGSNADASKLPQKKTGESTKTPVKSTAAKAKSGVLLFPGPVRTGVGIADRTPQTWQEICEDSIVACWGNDVNNSYHAKTRFEVVKPISQCSFSATTLDGFELLRKW